MDAAACMNRTVKSVLDGVYTKLITSNLLTAKLMVPNRQIVISWAKK